MPADSCATPSVRFGRVEALRGVSLAIAARRRHRAGRRQRLRQDHACCACCTASSATAASATRPSRRRAQAMVFQRPFMLHLSVWNNLRARALARRRAGRRARRAGRRGAAARRARGAARPRPARALSGGEQQRLALARAWAVRPDILFLDEPTASLDPSAKNEVEALLEGFARDGMTLVMSTPQPRPGQAPGDPRRLPRPRRRFRPTCRPRPSSARTASACAAARICSSKES